MCIRDRPSFVLKGVYGEMADAILLHGQRVIPEKLLNNEFKFKFEDIDEALFNLR